jgi:hypothetical protein
VREVFAVSSVLPEPLSAALKGGRMPINVGARGMVYNARMVDLIRFLSLVRTYAAAKPQAATAAKPQAATSAPADFSETQ